MPRPVRRARVHALLLLVPLAGCAGGGGRSPAVPMPEGIYRIEGMVGSTLVRGQLQLGPNVMLFSNQGNCHAKEAASLEERKQIVQSRTLVLHCGVPLEVRWDREGNVHVKGTHSRTEEKVVGRNCEVWNTDAAGRQTTCRKWANVTQLVTTSYTVPLRVERIIG